MFSDFISSEQTSLKICGVTNRNDADRLVEIGVPALGLNFWPSSKRYCSPEEASVIAAHIAGDLIRVGVFVNNSRPLADELIDECLIDVVQLHGDESEEDIAYFLDQKIPVIRAVSATALPEGPLPQENFALLIDTPAGKDYGGTGKTFDWALARDFALAHPGLPILLAGGITPDNAAAALEALKPARPAALDVASGAEYRPGEKDFEKIAELLRILS